MSYTQLQLVKDHGEALAADIEGWMADDLRRWLGPEWSVASVQDTHSFQCGR